MPPISTEKSVQNTKSWYIELEMSSDSILDLLQCDHNYFKVARLSISFKTPNYPQNSSNVPYVQGYVPYVIDSNKPKS